MIKKLFAFFSVHKFISLLIIVAVAGGGYYVYKKYSGGAASTRYVLAAAQKETLITAVSGSGQISANNQVEIKPKVAGDVIKVAAQVGWQVKADDLLVQLDARDARKSVRDAQANLTSAQLAWEKLKQPATAYQIMQAENSLAAAQTALSKLKLSQPLVLQKTQDSQRQAEDALTKDYNDAFNTITSAFLNLPNIVNNLNNILYSYELGLSEPSLGVTQWNVAALLSSTHSDDQLKLQGLQVSAESDYRAAKSKYDMAFVLYKNASRYSDRPTIDTLLTAALDATKAIAQAAKSESSYLDAWGNYRTLRSLQIFSKVAAYQTNLSSYVSQTNSSLTNLSAAANTIKNDQQSLTNAVKDVEQLTQNNPLDLVAAEASVKEKQASLDNLKAGADPLDIKSQELAVQQRRNALSDALEQLADYAIRASFDGTVAAVNVKTGDSAAAGAAVVVLITPQLVAEISLNEVDAAKVSVGQKVTLTFDAVSDLTLTGQVAQIDTLGTVSQGVVTYSVKIALDTQDERIKPGMSVAANIITDTKVDVLTVPNAAVKANNGFYYVEVPEEKLNGVGAMTASGIVLNKPLRQQTVQIGLANDSSTEIVSGLNEGEWVIVRAIIVNNSAKTTATQSRSGLQLLGGGGPR